MEIGFVENGNLLNATDQNKEMENSSVNNQTVQNDQNFLLVNPDDTQTSHLPEKNDYSFQLANSENKNSTVKVIDIVEESKLFSQNENDSSQTSLPNSSSTLMESIGADPSTPTSPSVVSGPSSIQQDEFSQSSFAYEDPELQKSEFKATYNVFVGDLRSEVTEEDLLETFSRCGPIHSVHVIRDRVTGEQKGFGFVHFETKEGQQNALSEEFCRAIIKGRPCRTSMSDEKNTLFIGNLPTDLNSVQVKDLLQQLCGPIVNVELKTGPPPSYQSRGFCFAVFDNHQTADKARKLLSTQTIMGRHLNVSWADNQREVSDDVMAKVKTLFVSNISSTVTDDTLRILFSQYGEVVNCVIVKNQQTKESRGFAFVEFKERNQTEAALKLHGFEVAGQKISVELAKPPPPDKPRKPASHSQPTIRSTGTSQSRKQGGSGTNRSGHSKNSTKGGHNRNSLGSTNNANYNTNRNKNSNRSNANSLPPPVDTPGPVAYDARTGEYYSLDLNQWEHIRRGNSNPPHHNNSGNRGRHGAHENQGKRFDGNNRGRNESRKARRNEDGSRSGYSSQQNHIVNQAQSYQSSFQPVHNYQQLASNISNQTNDPLLSQQLHLQQLKDLQQQLQQQNQYHLYQPSQQPTQPQQPLPLQQTATTLIPSIQLHSSSQRISQHQFDPTVYSTYQHLGTFSQLQEPIYGPQTNTRFRDQRYNPY